MHANHTIANATITGIIHMLHLPSLLTGATPGQRQEDVEDCLERHRIAVVLRGLFAVLLAAEEPHGGRADFEARPFRAVLPFI